eukprot:507284-Prorocentrum_minimum.AAC.1
MGGATLPTCVILRALVRLGVGLSHTESRPVVFYEGLSHTYLKKASVILRVGPLCKLAGQEDHITDRLVVATGGLSFPAVGTDGTGHRILKKQGHSLVPTYPALTPLTGPHPNGEQLAGVSLYGRGRLSTGRTCGEWRNKGRLVEGV